MASGYLAKPGEPGGPCKGPCRHTDCAKSRADAASVCPHCHEPIGFGSRFYSTWGVLSHAACEEDSIAPRPS